MRASSQNLQHFLRENRPREATDGATECPGEVKGQFSTRRAEIDRASASATVHHIRKGKYRVFLTQSGNMTVVAAAFGDQMTYLAKIWLTDPALPCGDADAGH